MSLALTEIPQTIDAGTSVSYTRTLADYPATDGWALTLWLAGAGTASAVATASGDSFVVTLAATATAALPPGIYTYVERVTKADEIYDVARGTIVVRPDVAQATAGSLQSWEEKTIAVLQDSITGQMTDAIASYQIHGRAVNRIPLEERVKLLNQLRAQVAQQKSGRFSTTVFAEFGPARWTGRR